VIHDSAPEHDSVNEAQSAPAADPIPEVPAPVEGAQLPRDSAVLAVDVPADAEIYVNGSKTMTEGSHRRYMSTGLISGRTYPYEVRAVVDRGGRQRTITKFVTLTAGFEAKMSFEFADGEQPETMLTLYVPAEAKVNLAGTDTEKTGSERVFTTARLEAGQVWDDYRVRVTLDRGGQKITKEETVTLRGGEDHELRFDFNESFVASN
jgi:uncharacterized protein (TIGR03000 family)